MAEAGAGEMVRAGRRRQGIREANNPPEADESVMKRLDTDTRPHEGAVEGAAEANPHEGSATGAAEANPHEGSAAGAAEANPTLGKERSVGARRRLRSGGLSIGPEEDTEAPGKDGGGTAYGG